MQCPNCNYKLVLLSNRRKYKCSLCSNLYLQKLIENKEFRKWNKLQKQQDFGRLDITRKQELKQIRDIKRALKYLFNPPKILDKGQYFKEKSREWRTNNKDYDLKRKKEYRLKNKEIVLVRTRIRNHRMRQEQIAIELNKNFNRICFI